MTNLIIIYSESEVHKMENRPAGQTGQPDYLGPPVPDAEEPAQPITFGFDPDTYATIVTPPDGQTPPSGQEEGSESGYNGNKAPGQTL
jgi:hypothetical protein